MLCAMDVQHCQSRLKAQVKLFKFPCRFRKKMLMHMCRVYMLRALIRWCDVKINWETRSFFFFLC